MSGRPALAIAVSLCAALLFEASSRAQNAKSDEGPAALAISARDQGEPERALSLWEKAVELSPTDAFLINQKAWSYLALGKIKDAKKTFAKAAEFSTESADISEARFGLGLSQYLDADLKTSAKTLEGVAEQSSYLYPLASVWLAKVAARLGKPDVASLYLKHSLDQDPLHPGALDTLGELYASHQMGEEALQCFEQALSQNADDSRAKEGLRKSKKELGAAAASSRTISEPLLQRPSAPPASAPLRIALFTDASGSPTTLAKVRFSSGADFKLSKNGKALADASANELWEAAWDPDSRVLEVRDLGGKLRYAGRDIVRIEPSVAGASVLLRDAKLTNPGGLDAGDRELRGSIELRPAASGFFVINELGTEEYLFSQLGALSPAGAPAEALKAQAVVLRTGLAETRKKFATTDYDLCDSSRCQVYLGLSQERSEATSAVTDTAGQTLSSSSGPVHAALHGDCAGITEEGIIDAPAALFDISSAAASVSASTQTAGDQDGLRAALSRSTEGVERLLHSDPAKGFYDNASPYAPVVWQRWARILDPREIEEAADPAKPIGALDAIKVLSRTSTGRVGALELDGDSGRWSAASEDELERFFSRLGLRSSLVSFQPLYRDKRIEWVVAWGAGSGSGHGFCVAGALGQAYEGRDYKEILKHYFPGAEVQ